MQTNTTLGDGETSGKGWLGSVCNRPLNIVYITHCDDITKPDM